MNHSQFLRGMGVGIAAGAALGAAMTPHKKSHHHSCKCAVRKAMRSVGEVMENISDAMS